MSSEVPIELQNVQDVLATKVPLDWQSFQQLIGSSNPEVRTIVFEQLWNNQNRSVSFEDDEVDRFCLSFLKNSFIENIAGDWRLSRFDSATYFLEWFKLTWRLRGKKKSVLLDARAVLAELCHNGDQESREVILTVVLEHLFTDVQVAEFFWPWSTNHELAPIYTKALQLSEEWRKFENSSEYHKLKQEQQEIAALPPDEQEKLLLKKTKEYLEE